MTVCGVIFLAQVANLQHGFLIYLASDTQKKRWLRSTIERRRTMCIVYLGSLFDPPASADA